MNIANARALLPQIKECAVKAGIYQHWFLAFGTLLGAVRPTARTVEGHQEHVQGFMEHDDDMDIGIFSDRVTAQQEQDYVAFLQEAGMFRKRSAFEQRTDNKKLLWFTLRKNDPPTGTKCCHWFFYRWKGFIWHSKGRDWLREIKFPNRKYPHTLEDEAIGKGMPGRDLVDLMEIDFEGERYNIPVTYGHCLDSWYPKWRVHRKGGASKAEYIMKVGKWEDEQSWKIF